MVLRTHMALFVVMHMRYLYRLIVSTYTQDDCEHVAHSKWGLTQGLKNVYTKSVHQLHVFKYALPFLMFVATTVTGKTTT